MRTTIVTTAALTVALLGAPGVASAYDVDNPPVLSVESTTVTIQPGGTAFVDTNALVSRVGVTPGLYSDKISVESGDCAAEWSWEGGEDGVEIQAPSEPGVCTVAFQAHDTVTSTLAEPATIHVTVAAPPPPAPVESSTAPAPVPAGPIDDGADVTEPVVPAPAPDMPTRSGGWQEVAVMGLAGLATVVGGGFALARHSRRSSYTHEEI